jgi:glycerol-3-phosphate O-acyltransferase
VRSPNWRCWQSVSNGKVASLSISFWSEVQELRDLFKFEFFYPDTQLFEQQIDAELCRDEPNWQTLLSESPDNARLIMNRLSPKLGHVALTVFAEAYSIGTDILIRQQRKSR